MYLHHLLLWGENDIMLIDQSEYELIKLIKPISNLLVVQSTLIFTTTSGDLYRCKGHISINTTLSGQSFKIFENAQIFTVRTNNIILCLSREGNIVCVEWGN